MDSWQREAKDNEEGEQAYRESSISRIRIQKWRLYFTESTNLFVSLEGHNLQEQQDPGVLFYFSDWVVWWLQVASDTESALGAQ